MAININDLAQPVRIPDAPVSWSPPRRLQKFLGPAVVIAANDTNGEVVPILGTGRIRVVAKVSAAGTLRVRWRLADGLTSLATPASNPDDPGTALVAATELVRDYAINPGFAYMEVAIVNGAGASTVSYVDIFCSNPGN